MWNRKKEREVVGGKSREKEGEKMRWETRCKQSSADKSIYSPCMADDY